MNPAAQLLTAVRHVIESHRRTGSSTLLQQLSQAHRAYIVAGNQSYADVFGDAGVSLQTIVRDTEGKGARALFFDNHALLELVDRCLDQFQASADDVRRANQFTERAVVKLGVAEGEAMMWRRHYEAAKLVAQDVAIGHTIEVMGLKARLRERAVRRITVNRRK